MSHNEQVGTPILAALVTGGGRGIGKSISIRLAKEQPVLILGRTESDLQATKQQVESRSGTIEYLQVDLKNTNLQELVHAKLQALNWSISSLVLNAGIGKSGESESYPDDLFREIFDVNLLSNLPLTRVVLPEMRMRKSGTICMINSTGGLKGLSHDAAYCASKHGQIGLARALAVEYGKYGISVVPICPGFVESEMTDRTIRSIARRRKISNEDARAIVARTNLQRRIIPAEEVAEIVAFACSGLAPSLSGTPLVLGGGVA